MEIVEIQKVLLTFEKRAENKPAEAISDTFVDAEPLLSILQAPTSQVILGRRGTGKTHALKYCQSTLPEGDAAVFLDIRSIGSNGSFYSDTSFPAVERGLRLVNDILQALLDELYVVALRRIDDGYDANQITLRLDDFSDALGRMKVIGKVDIETTDGLEESSSRAGKFGLSLTPKAVTAAASFEGDKDTSTSSSVVEKMSGEERRTIDFAQTQVSLSGLIDILGIEKLWLFLDEWSETPRAIQPYLADLVRKTILPIGKTIIKIGAIEQRSSFIHKLEGGDYIGLELGADISADLNLDEFLVFDFDENKSLAFFRELIFKNFLAISSGSPPSSSAAAFSNLIFTEKRAVEEFTRAVEGVPRDALNLMTRIATKSYGKKAGVDGVRKAALDWYTRDKVNVVSSNRDLERTLNHIIDEVIGNRRARAFLFPSNTRHSVIDALYDARVIHLLKKNISSRDEPGRRYDAWKIDYGCYVDLIKTQNAPLGLLPDENESFAEVPSDDYRSIRRAVLYPDDLDRFLASEA